METEIFNLRVGHFGRVPHTLSIQAIPRTLFDNSPFFPLGELGGEGGGLARIACPCKRLSYQTSVQEQWPVRDQTMYMFSDF